MIVEFCPCRHENHKNVGFGLRLLSGLLERWQGRPAIQQVSSMLFPTVNCPHLESEHRFHHCPCRWPTPRVHLARIPANRPDQWCQCRHCPRPLYRRPPQTCPTVRTKQSDFVFFLPQMWVWTVTSDDEDAHFVGFVLVHPTSRHDQEESQELKTQALAHVHGSKHTVEFSRNRIQWERVNRKPGHHTSNSVFRETSQIQRLTASNIWEREVTMSRPTRFNLPSCSLCRTIHMAIGSRFVLARESSRKKAWRSQFLRAGSFFTNGDDCNTLFTETGSVPALITGRHWTTIARRWVKLISIHGHTRHSCGT